MRALLMRLESGFVAKQFIEQELCGIFFRSGNQEQFCAGFALRLRQEARQNIGDPVGLSFPGFPLRDDQQAAAVDGLADGSLVDCISVHGACSLLVCPQSPACYSHSDSQVQFDIRRIMRVNASITVEVRASRASRAEGGRYDGRPAVRANDVGSRAGYPAGPGTSALPFVKLTLVPLSHAFRRMVWNPDDCDKYGHFNKSCGKRETEVVDTLKVRDAKDVEQAVRAAIASEQPLEIIGHGSKRLIGQPMATNALLDLSALNAVTSYEPTELIITVQAGAPLADVKSLIDSRNQQFAFEPINTSPLLGTPGVGTIGGMIGAGLAGPRRIKAGGARDHLLGAQAVSGFGDSFKTGGKVVKNVTGYDLCKLLAGSWGTLAVMTEVTLKVMPRPESERTLVLRGLDDDAANRAMTAALGSPFDVSGAAHVPNSVFRAGAGALADLLADPLADLGSPREAVTLLRLEGITASAIHRAAALAAVLAPFGTAEI